MSCSRANKSLFDYLFDLTGSAESAARLVEIISSDGSLTVTKNVLLDRDQWDLIVVEKLQLNGALTLTPDTIYLQGNAENITMDWDWTKDGSPTAVSTQELDDGLGYDPISNALRTYDLNGVIASRTVKVKADDGLGYGSLSAAEVIDQITFGNYFYYGELAESLDGSGEANIVAKIKALSTNTDKWSGSGSKIVFTFTGTGNATTPKYYYLAFPASWDPNDYFEDPGYVSLAGFFQLGDGIRSGFFKIGEYNISNDATTPYTEAYTIWQSASDHLEDITYNVKHYG
jgi:hypothetical protein